MNSIFKDINVDYKPAEHSLWTGRQTNQNLEPQYWYQKVNLLHINDLNIDSNIDIGVIGYACDEGVRRNQGRIGAKEGPKFLRKTLAKLPLHFDSKTIADFGNIKCIDGDMESCQNALAKTINTLISNKTFPIVIGGGHDVAYAHFMGIRSALKEKAKIGIINFDAHFDLRPVEDKSNSGTPFNQIISESKKTNQPVDYFVIGIQQQSNTKELFNIAKENHVDYVSNFECTTSKRHIKKFKKQLKSFIEKNDHLYITIDMDGFSSAYSPGVSATSSLGFSPHFFFEILEFILKSNKVISCDIAEINPTLDIDNQTSKLGAKIVDFIVRNINK